MRFERRGVEAVAVGEAGIIGDLAFGEFSRLVMLAFRFLLVRLLPLLERFMLPQVLECWISLSATDTVEGAESCTKAGTVADLLRLSVDTSALVVWVKLHFAISTSGAK